jgi:hypothetical protein
MWNLIEHFFSYTNKQSWMHFLGRATASWTGRQEFFSLLLSPVCFGQHRLASAAAIIFVLELKYTSCICFFIISGKMKDELRGPYFSRKEYPSWK